MIAHLLHEKSVASEQSWQLAPLCGGHDACNRLPMDAGVYLRCSGGQIKHTVHCLCDILAAPLRSPLYSSQQLIGMQRCYALLRYMLKCT